MSVRAMLNFAIRTHDEELAYVSASRADAADVMTSADDGDDGEVEEVCGPSHYSHHQNPGDRDGVPVFRVVRTAQAFRLHRRPALASGDRGSGSASANCTPCTLRHCVKPLGCRSRCWRLNGG